MPSITFIRHAESQANVDGVWNGRTDGPLSRAGEDSLRPLAARLADWDFDLVISSPLQRALQTAESFSDSVEIWDDFVEIDLGKWDGWTLEQVLLESGEELRRSVTTREVPMGGTGETLNEAGGRAGRAVNRLAERLGEEGHAAVVTHGGLLQTILHRHLAGRGRRVHSFVANTSVTRLVWSFGQPRLATFNDTGHLNSLPPVVGDHLRDGDPVLALIRHGRTRANVEGRWQGHGDWGLDALGRRQAEALASWYGKHSTVYSSPLERASQTAGYLALNGVETIDNLKEISMGRWEGMTTDEILDVWPGLMERIYRDGVDLRRGEDGESWGELTARFANTLRGLEPDHTGPTVVVAHGGAIRSYVSSLTAVPETHAEALFTPPNTSVTHVALTDRGPMLLDYAVAPHLESLT